MVKISVPYEHNPADLGRVDLAVTRQARPDPDDWRPALRDTAGGQRVVWARFEPAGGRIHNVWVRDRHGQRKTGSARL